MQICEGNQPIRYKIINLNLVIQGFGMHDPEFQSHREQETFPFSKSFRLALGHMQSPIQSVPGVMSPELKRTGREVKSAASTTEVKNDCRFSTVPPTSLHGVGRVKFNFKF